MLIPLFLLVGLIVGQAIDVGQTVAPWVKQNLEQPDKLTTYLQQLPFYEYIELLERHYIKFERKYLFEAEYVG